MPTEFIKPLELRRRLGRDDWGIPVPFGDDGWRIDGMRERVRILVSEGPMQNVEGQWLHASISREGQMPSYKDLCLLHYAVWGDAGWAYQVFPPHADHVNIHEYALHLWGKPDGSMVMPNFGINGSI